MNLEEAEDFNLEIRTELNLRTPIDEQDKSFLLVIQTSVIEPEHNYVKISFKANAYFESKEKLLSYDDVVKNEGFPIAFEKISQKIDEILEILDYPKLNMFENMPTDN